MGENGGQDRLVASTRYGPVTEADRDFVVKVRAAGLWEYPLGELAMERGTSKAMQAAGEHLVVGHAGLDAACRRVAAELGIIPSDEASPQQRGSVRTAAGRRGQEFDATAVAVMR
jgi:predicted outer membrane protein